jgi:multidrug efflux system outer membrane protein
MAWNDWIADPMLQDLQQRASRHSPDVRIAALRVQEARAAYGMQRADTWPTVGANAQGTRSRVPGDLNLTGQPVVSGSYQAGLGISAWEIDFWNRLGSLRDAAQLNYLASDAARRAVTNGLLAEVANAYLGLREYDERLAIARKTIASRQASLRIFQRRVEVGSTARLDLLQVQTLLAQAQALGAQLEQGRATQAHALTALVGESMVLPPASQGLDAHAIRPVTAALPSELLNNRPDLLAAELRLRAARANIEAARAAFFPRITLTTSIGTASAQLDGLFSSGSRAWNFSPSLSVPLFDAGRLRANLDLAEVRTDLAVASYEQAVQAAFREVADGLSAQHHLQQQLHIQQQALQAQQERERLARLRYDNGTTNFLEVLDAQRELLSAEQQAVQTRRALLTDRVRLFAALGGGANALPVPPESRP